MDLLSKGYKFLSELDDPKGEPSATDLESSLDGVAEKWLGWARGGAPGSSPQPQEELMTISGAGPAVESVDLLDDHPGEGDQDEHNPFAVEAELDGMQLQPVEAVEAELAAAAEGSDGEGEEGEEGQEGQEGEEGEAEQRTEAPEVPEVPEATASQILGDPSAKHAHLAHADGMETEHLTEMLGEAVLPKSHEFSNFSFDPLVQETKPMQLAPSERDAVPALDELTTEAPLLSDALVPSLAEVDSVKGEYGGTQAETQVEQVDQVEIDGSRQGGLEDLAQALVTANLSEEPAAVRRLQADLADAQGLLKQREKQLSDLSNVLAEMEARDAQRREQSQATKSKAVDAVRQAERLASQWQKRAEQAETTKEEIKERAAIEVRRLKQEARDMEQELHKAQETWREKIRKAEARAADLEKEGKEAANISNTELAKMKARLRAQAAGSEETREELEAYKARAEDEMTRLNERMRAMADSELRLRHELQSSEQARQELQERVVELSGQLEHAQQAYSEAAREVGQMSLRLNELEFGQKADSHSEDLLREELAATRERFSMLEERHKECVWMRDHALQQAEEVRMKLQAAEEQQEQLRKQMAEQGDADAVSSKTPQADALDVAQQEVTALQHQMQRLIEQHETELQQQAAMSTEEIDYLKRKNDEKDKRLEILTCERNALRYESSEARPSKVAATPPREGGDKLVDLEDGFSFKELSREQGAMKAFLSDGDLVLKRFSKLLFVSPTTRRLFYGYVLLLHIWIWVVLHRAAAVHSAHAISKPVAPG